MTCSRAGATHDHSLIAGALHDRPLRIGCDLRRPALAGLDRLPGPSFGPSPDELQRDARGCSRVGESQFVGADGCDDAALIGRADQVGERGCLDIGMHRPGVLVHRVGAGICHCTGRGRHGFVGRRPGGVV